MRMGQAFTRRLTVRGTAPDVFDAIATLEGLRGWWTPLALGSVAAGQEIRLEFEGRDEHIVMHVEEICRPTTLLWTCRAHTAMPDWNGTQVAWSVAAGGENRCELRLTHAGLTPDLECFDHCRAGWDRFLASLRSYVEQGVGHPYRSEGVGVPARGSRSR